MIVSLPGSVDRVRLGITVSARVGNAVVRNRVKRFVREMFRTRVMSVDGVKDVVVIAKPGAETLNYGAVVLELERPLVAAIRG